MLLDEGEGRRIAKSLGLKVTGVLGVLLRSKHEGRIVSLRETMEPLQTQCGFRIGWGPLSSIVQAEDVNTLWRSDVFDRWLSGLADKVGKARIVQRLDRVAAGNFGDCEPVGEGVSEMRIHVGPGYRLYGLDPRFGHRG